MRTFFAAPVTLDVIRLLALAVALRDRAFELVGIWEDDRLAGAGLYEAVVDGLCHGGWARVFALDDVLAGCLLEGPYNRLGRGALEVVGDRAHAIAVDRQHDEVVLALRLFGDGEAKHLVWGGVSSVASRSGAERTNVLPGNGELDIAIRAYGPYAPVFAVDQLQGVFLPLREGEAGARVLAPCFCRRACEARRGRWAVLRAIALLELALLGGGLVGGP
jgi:hypothetical protein